MLLTSEEISAASGYDVVTGVGKDWMEGFGSLDVIDGDFGFLLQPLTKPGENRCSVAEALARGVLTKAS